MVDSTPDTPCGSEGTTSLVREAETQLTSLATQATYQQNELDTIVDWLEFTRDSSHACSLRYQALLEAVDAFSSVYVRSKTLDEELHAELKKNLDLYGEVGKALLDDIGRGKNSMSTLEIGGVESPEITRSLSPLAEYLFDALFDDPIHGLRFFDLHPDGWRVEKLNADPFEYITSMKSGNRNYYHALLEGDLSRCASLGYGAIGRNLKIYIELFDLHDEVDIETSEIAPRTKSPEEFAEMFLQEPNEEENFGWWNIDGRTWAEYYEVPNLDRYD